MTEAAAQARRRQEYAAQEEAWRKVEALIGAHLEPPSTRTRFRHAFLSGWQAATNYWTARPTKGVRR